VQWRNGSGVRGGVFRACFCNDGQLIQNNKCAGYFCLLLGTSATIAKRVSTHTVRFCPKSIANLPISEEYSVVATTMPQGHPESKPIDFKRYISYKRRRIGCEPGETEYLKLVDAAMKRWEAAVVN
jgi:hypothetical protein